MIMITASFRPDGRIDFLQEGPGFRIPAVIPPIYERVDWQLKPLKVYRSEREKFIGDLTRDRKASLSFQERIDRFSC